MRQYLLNENNPVISVAHLCKSFGPTVAVDDISFELQTGETFGLLGPNGAGKTTTINMMVGLLPPDSGEVRVNGDHNPTQAATRRQLGNAPQKLSLYEGLTAEENLRFFGKTFGLSGKRLKERVAWALEFVELTDRRNDRVKAYSGGMARRLNLACAMVHDPKILLLDEPTVGVDPQSRNAIFESIEKLMAEGRTIIYTTHYMEEAQRLCDRVAIMDHGRILDIDSVPQLIARHGGMSVIEAELTRTPDDRSRLPGQLDGTTLRIETDKPLEMVAELGRSGFEFTRMNIVKADLETVFLNLTGRRLRD